MPKYRQTYTLFKRGKYYYYRTYDETGVRTTAHTTGKTSMTAAKLYCDELFKANKLIPQSGQTFSQYAKGFFDDNSVYTKDNKLAANSAILYRSILDTCLIPLIGNKSLADINHTMLKKIRQELLDKGLSPATVKTRMITLHIIIKSAYLDGLIQRDPFDSLGKLKISTPHRDAFTIGEVAKIYSSAKDEMKKHILMLALTGMRTSEYAAVSIAELNKEDGITYIHLERQYNKKEFKPLKSKKPRDIPISKELVSLVGDYCQDVSFSEVFTKYIKKLDRWKERKLCAHSFRHFFISSAKSYGINHLKVEAIAGHSLKGIQEVYTNFKVPDLAEIIKWQEWAYGQITGIEIK